MKRSSMTAAVAAIAVLISPVSAFAQGTGADSGSTGNSSRLAAPPSPGTNSAGTAQSSGSGVNTGAGVTTGAAGTGTMARPQAETDAAINEENKTIDRRLKSICRGC